MFLVVKPLPPAFVENPTPLHVRSNCSLSYPDNNFVPIDHVVVPTTEHQLPLGVLSYGTLDKNVLIDASITRTIMEQSHFTLYHNELRASLARLKAKVIQKIINYELDVASEIYQKNSQYLDLAAKKEISTFAHTKYDADFVCFYFPDLPERMTTEDEDQMVSLEALDTVVQARRKAIQLAQLNYDKKYMYSYTPVAVSVKASAQTVGPITLHSPP